MDPEVEFAESFKKMERNNQMAVQRITGHPGAFRSGKQLHIDAVIMALQFCRDREKLIAMPEEVYQAVRRTAINAGHDADFFLLVDECRQLGKDRKKVS